MSTDYQAPEREINMLKRLTQIGIALSKEKNINRLFEMILEFAMDFTQADGGTLYVISEDRKTLNFVVAKNKTLAANSKLRDLSTHWNPIPLMNDDGSPNLSNVSSYCAIKGEVINIPDVYESEEFNFQGPREFDLRTGYRSKSMLVVPMKNHEDEIIGVLQLINAKDNSTGQIISFSSFSQEMAECLASQAAIALTNRMLIMELDNLFESSIRVIASAIDEKSPYTSGHSRRVADLAVEMAKRINETKNGPFANLFFNEEELKEIALAALLHDLGKISIPEHIMDKRKKLESVLDRIELIKMRYEILKRERATSKDVKSDEDSEIEKEIRFIEEVNSGNFPLSDEMLERLRRISKRTYRSDKGDMPLVTKEELKHLSVRAGTLTQEEKAIIESHAEITFKMLSQLPFPRKLRNVPFIAGSHHEKLNGKGYPRNLKAEDLPLQSRILSIADIFEALTAKDRPYKKAKTLSQAIRILKEMAEKGEVDRDLVDLLVESGIAYEYGRRELLPEQIDI